MVKLRANKQFQPRMSDNWVVPLSYFALGGVGLGWLGLGFKQRVWRARPLIIASVVVIALSVALIASSGASWKVYPGMALVYSIPLFLLIGLGRVLNQLVLQGKLK